MTQSEDATKRELKIISVAGNESVVKQLQALAGHVAINQNVIVIQEVADVTTTNLFEVDPKDSLKAFEGIAKTVKIGRELLNIPKPYPGSNHFGSKRKKGK